MPKLYFATPSPYARKVRALILEPDRKVN
jgi:hypothetical protein